MSVSAIIPLEQGRPFEGVRIRGSENAIKVKQIPGAGQEAINADGCGSCAGRRFARKAARRSRRKMSSARKIFRSFFELSNNRMAQVSDDPADVRLFHSLAIAPLIVTSNRNVVLITDW